MLTDAEIQEQISMGVYTPGNDSGYKAPIQESNLSQRSIISPATQESQGYAPATSDSNQAIQTSQERQEAIAYAQTQEYRDRVASDDPNVAGAEISLQSIQNKEEILSNLKAVENSYTKAGIDIPQSVKTEIEQARAQVNSQLTNFQKAAGGGYSVGIDVPMAVRAGIGDNTIERLMGEGAGEAIRGAKNYWSEVDTQRASVAEQNKALTNLESYKEGEGYNIDKAISEGHLSDVQKARFDSKDIVAAQARIGASGQLPYLNTGTKVASPTVAELSKYGITIEEQAKIASIQSRKGFADLPSSYHAKVKLPYQLIKMPWDPEVKRDYPWALPIFTTGATTLAVVGGVGLLGLGTTALATAIPATAKTMSMNNK